MGYRLDIQDVDHPELHFYGTKLLGYVDEPEFLLTNWFLKSLDPDYEIGSERWDGVPDFHITAEQFCIFVKLYREDWIRRYGVDDLHTNEGWWKVLQMQKTDSDKVLSWG